MPDGPQPIPSDQRRQHVSQIAHLLQRHYGDRLLALGVYGSLARGSDGPFSDIEMHCIIQGENIDTSYEWSTGPWKAEVDVYSPEVIRRRAAEVNGDWSITHSQFTHVWVLYDPDALFPQLEVLSRSQPQSAFDQAMAEITVGDIYELVGKVLNAREKAAFASLPFYTLLIAHRGACLIGLAHRYLYTSLSTLFNESLALPDRPSGYDALCQAAISGELADPLQNITRAEEFWRGIEFWVERHHLPIKTTLEKLLTGTSDR